MSVNYNEKQVLLLPVFNFLGFVCLLLSGFFFVAVCGVLLNYYV